MARLLIDVNTDVKQTELGRQAARFRSNRTENGGSDSLIPSIQWERDHSVKLGPVSLSCRLIDTNERNELNDATE